MKPLALILVLGLAATCVAAEPSLMELQIQNSVLQWRIDQLQKENAELKSKLLQSGISLPDKKPDAPAAEPAWTRMDGDNSDPYKDIHSRLDHGYNDVHEATHQLNNSLNNRWGFYSQHRYAIYCLKGRIADVPEPPLTIAAIAAAVPQEKRRDGYQLYLIDQQRHWNKNPCYLLDEWVAYANEWDWDHTDIGLRHAVAFCDYAETLLQLAEKCPGYDTTKLRTFIRWQQARVASQQESAKTMDLATAAAPPKQKAEPRIQWQSPCANGRCSR